MRHRTTRIMRAACAGLGALLLLATLLVSAPTITWGGNDQGQRNVPPGLSNVTAIAAGYAHSLALKRDGSVVAWEDDTRGQMDMPAGLSGVIAIAAGNAHSLA